jgi:hypothetical protein
VLIIALSGIPAGAATYFLAGAIGRNRRGLICGFGFLVGMLAGLGFDVGVRHVYDIPLLCVAGAILGPLAALRLSRPYDYNN